MQSKVHVWPLTPLNLNYSCPLHPRFEKLRIKNTVFDPQFRICGWECEILFLKWAWLNLRIQNPWIQRNNCIYCKKICKWVDPYRSNSCSSRLNCTSVSNNCEIHFLELLSRQGVEDSWLFGWGVPSAGDSFLLSNYCLKKCHQTK